MTATYAKFTLQLNTVTDADVIEYLNAQANKNDTIRRALRAWMVRGGPGSIQFERDKADMKRL